jgi:hypothetical protein
VLSGSCHCRRIKVALSTHNAAMISDNQGALHLRTTGSPDDLYRFGFGAADFHVCGNCGVFVAATWNDGALAYGVVNIYALDAALNFGDDSPMQFDEEDEQVRNERRRLNWTPTQFTAHAP